MICPKCGSNQVNTQVVSETDVVRREKGFGCIKACLGYLIFNVPGILCGLCGMGKGRTTTTTRSRSVHQCQTCGHRF